MPNAPTEPAALSHRRTWLLLAGAFVTFAVGAGSMHAYTVFLVAFIEAFGWTRADVSVAYAVSQLVTGTSSPLVGVLVDRLGPRRLILIGGAVLALGAFATSHATSLWQIDVLYGVVMTLGANCLGLVVFVPLLSRHFVRRRGMAVSIVQSANGFARAYSAPVTTLMIDGLGWRGAYLWQGVFVAVVIAPLGAAAEAKALGIARALRRQGIAVEQEYRGNMKRRMQRANKLNARAAVILGDDELAKGVAQLKDLDSGAQREVALDSLADVLRN